MKEKLKVLAEELEGELYDDLTMRTLYATDASAYREMPLAVAIPESIEDIKKLIAFANKEHTSLIPRTAGTSLGGTGGRQWNYCRCIKKFYADS